MKNYVAPGSHLTIPAPVDIEAGDVVIAGALKGVAQQDAAQGDDVVIVTEGVYEFTKVGSQAWTVGALVYWDAANQRATTASSGNTLIGAATVAVGSAAGATRGRVKINV